MERGVITGFTAKLGAVLTIADLSEELIDQNLVFDNDKNSPKEFFDAPFFPGRSIVMISVDALRPDHLGSSGYDRPVSKNIDALAAKSVVFERAYSCAPVSSMSIPSIQTGVRMENILKLGTKLPSTLAGRLKKAGYKTIGLFPKKVFSVGPALMAEIERTGFEFEKVIELEREAQKDAAEVKKAVLSEQGRPLFLWVHFYEPHLPYHCHDKPFGSEPIDCYDAEIQHLDDTLGELIPWLDQQLDDPILVFTADHGEAFGEHGRFYHSTDLHEEQIRVPLFFRLPQVDPRSVRAPVSNVSIAPTLEALVLENPSNSGSDLRGLMLKEKETTPVLAAVEDKRTVIDGHQKLICNGWPDGPCAYYLLDTDPNEKNNLAGKRPKEAAMLLARLKNKERSELTKVSGGLPRPIVLGRLERADAVDGLLELAEKKGPYAVEAAMLLAMMQRYEFRRTLSKLHDSDNDQVAAWSCIGSTLLEKSCPKEAVLKFLNEKTKLGKWSAVALGNMKYEIALNPLLSNLESKDPQLRARSAQALGELGTPKAVPALIKLAKKVPQTRWAAIDALGLIGDSRACPVLLEIIKTDPDQHNKKKCTRALEKIND